MIVRAHRFCNIKLPLTHFLPTNFNILQIIPAMQLFLFLPAEDHTLP